MEKTVLVYPNVVDRLRQEFYTYEESIELFGEPDEYELKEYYVEIPKELHDEFIATQMKLSRLEDELTRLLKKG